jgi:hypothetical protein
MLVGEVSEMQPMSSTGVMAMACMKEEGRRNTGTPITRSNARPTRIP